LWGVVERCDTYKDPFVKIFKKSALIKTMISQIISSLSKASQKLFKILIRISIILWGIKLVELFGVTGMLQNDIILLLLVKGVKGVIIALDVFVLLIFLNLSLNLRKVIHSSNLINIKIHEGDAPQTKILLATLSLIVGSVGLNMIENETTALATAPYQLAAPLHMIVASAIYGMILFISLVTTLGAMFNKDLETKKLSIKGLIATILWSINYLVLKTLLFAIIKSSI